MAEEARLCALLKIYDQVKVIGPANLARHRDKKREIKRGNKKRE
jgi:hypothetical protein